MRKGLVFSVQADDERQCADQLARLCDLLQLIPLLPPTRSAGTDRWMARATTTAPVDDRGQAVR
jgi:hypothetical protein